MINAQEREEELNQLNRQFDNTLLEEGILPGSPLYQWSKMLQKVILTNVAIAYDTQERHEAQAKTIQATVEKFSNDLAVAQNEILRLGAVGEQTIAKQTELTKAQTDKMLTDLISRISSEMEKKAGEIVREKLPFFESRLYKTAKLGAIAKLLLLTVCILTIGYTSGYLINQHTSQIGRYCLANKHVDRHSGVSWCTLGDME